jgi:hypothetical protein
MRGLSDTFLTCLKTGFLSGITEDVKRDQDLNLEIRDSYINIYYKGNSLLKLDETKSFRYKAEISPKFVEGINIPIFFTEANIDRFIREIPNIKQNIVKLGKRSLEIEYEQMIIRANNFEPRNNSEYFIVDRQYVDPAGRFDLTGIFWEMHHRKRNQEVPVCLMELKFALNSDIKEVHDQLSRYYTAIKPRAAEIAVEMQKVFRQKLELGLYRQSEDRLDALKTLSFSKNIEQFQFILVLVDYNQNSSMLHLANLANLPFANQIKIYRCGFAMWERDMEPLSSNQ